MITNIDKKTTRNTKQKEIIRQIVLRSREHPTADMVYLEARKSIPNVSLGTVYRNLNMLVESGEIKALRIDNALRYDGNPAKHLHFVCTSCGNVYDLFVSPESVSINMTVEHHITEVRVELYGICKNCLNKEDENVC